jgi:hypothetical protein
MPTNYIKTLHEQGKGSIQSLEQKWDKAKEAAAKEGKADNYALITTIFKRMIGASQIEARIRLIATQDRE